MLMGCLTPNDLLGIVMILPEILFGYTATVILLRHPPELKYRSICHLYTVCSIQALNMSGRLNDLLKFL